MADRTELERALVQLFKCRAALHRGSETGLYFFELFGKPATPESFETIEQAALVAYATLGASCVHKLNRLGHCTRCGARPNDAKGHP